MDSRTTACEPMTAENKRKAGIINDRLNALSIDINENLKYIRDINNFLFSPEPLTEGESNKAEAKVAGWFDYTIDMLITINNVNCKIKDELETLKRELKD